MSTPHQWEDCPCGHHHDDHSVTGDLTVGCTGCLIAARNGDHSQIERIEQ